MELAADVVDEEAGPDDPLAEVVAPQILAPAGIRDGHVQVVRLEVVPEFRGDLVTERIGVVVHHHLGILARTAGEDQQHRRAGTGPDFDRTLDRVARKRAVRTGDFSPVADPVGAFAIHQQPDGQRGAVVVDLVELVSVFRVGDDHFEFAVADSMLNVLAGQQRRGGALHRAELDQRQREDPPLRQPGQHDEDAVSGGDAELDQQIGRLIGELAHIVEGEPLLLPLLVGPDHRELIAVASGPFVDDVVAEVVVFRRFDREVGGDLLRTNLFFGGSFHFLDITSMVVSAGGNSSGPAFYSCCNTIHRKRLKRNRDSPRRILFSKFD